MTDRLAEIQQWYGERTQPGRVIPFDDVPRGYAQSVVYMGWLLDEVERQRAEIELLQRNHADGLKVTGIPLKGNVT
ncbi:MAG TPA: hypothetical protein ENH62_07705 [Marinobacter sp.]|uniref:Uncharacterized protein n=1 Tax=marine sediment metagenome TaxID=412755 RepID=A0A0F9U3Y7_9ZZZZ|nr:hypothetical protein [Marinobacter sp.]